MKEELEQLISHYEYLILKEKQNDTINNIKVKYYETFVLELKKVLENEDKRKNPNKKNKNKKSKYHFVNQELIKSSIEPELVPKKQKKK